MQKKNVFMFALKNILDPQADLGQYSSSKITGKRSVVGKYSVLPFNASGLTPTSAAVPPPTTLAFGIAMQHS